MDGRESILTSIKKLIGMEAQYSAFDTDLIIHINSVFAILLQLGCGPTDGFKITGSDETWDEYVQDTQKLEFVKTFMYLKCKLVFDPPGSSTVLKAYQDEIKELEWRINVEAESTST